MQLLLLNISRDSQQLIDLISEAKFHLSQIRATPSPEPDDQDALAKRVFDPYIARKLNTFIPVSIIEVPRVEKTWDTIDEYLNGLHELILLAKTKEVTTWAVGWVLSRNSGLLTLCVWLDCRRPSALAPSTTATISLSSFCDWGSFHPFIFIPS